MAFCQCHVLLTKNAIDHVSAKNKGKI